MGLPKWKCHKEVEALKITSITRSEVHEGGLTLGFDGFPDLVVGVAWSNKHAPVVGGYWVQYEDGYQSFSPAEAFESGYSPIAPAAPITVPVGEPGVAEAVVTPGSGDTFEEHA